MTKHIGSFQTSIAALADTIPKTTFQINALVRSFDGRLLAKVHSRSCLKLLEVLMSLLASGNTELVVIMRAKQILAIMFVWGLFGYYRELELVRHFKCIMYNRPHAYVFRRFSVVLHQSY
jgi:hypothetical protein